jgi:hypothetical protein
VENHVKIKLLGAMLLLVSLALPMSTCSHYEDAQGTRIAVAQGETPPEGARQVTSRTYAFEDFHPTDPGNWVKALAFLWPVLALVILQQRKRGRIALGIRILEPALIGLSLYVIDFVSTFFADRRAIGAYLAFLAIGIYAVGSLWADVVVYREWKERSS